jgi:hypothetical protein
LNYLEKLPNAMTTIGNYAFSGCTDLNLKTLPNISSIQTSQDIFSGCSNLQISELPPVITAGLTDDKLRYRTKLFNGCAKITVKEIPENIYVLESNVFNGCTSMDTIIFPLTMGLKKGSVNSSIGANAFLLTAGSEVQRTYIFKSSTPPTGTVEATAFSKGSSVDAGALVLVPNAAALALYIAKEDAPFSQMNVRAKINTISIVAGENGSVTTEYGNIIDDAIDAQYGDNITFTFTPAEGYEVDEVSLDEAPVTPTDNAYTFIVTGKAPRVAGHALAVTFKASQPTGYPQQHAVNVGIYPNPAKDIVNISGKIEGKARLFDTTGKLLLETTKNALDISSYNKGVYIVKVNGQVIRFIKE